VAAAPVFLAMSLLPECHRWSERAILALDDATRGGADEMHLQAALGLSLMFARGGSDAARAALNRSLAIAEDRGEDLNQMQLLGPLHMFHMRVGDFRTSLHFAKRSSAVAETVADPAAITLAHSLLGISFHLIGDLSGARVELEAALRGPRAQHTGTIHLGFDHHDWAGIALARTLWVQGLPVQAVACARRTVENAASKGHPVTLSGTLNRAISVFLWTDDLQSAEQHLDWFISHAESHGLLPWLTVGRGIKGQLALRRGDTEEGVGNLR